MKKIVLAAMLAAAPLWSAGWENEINQAARLHKKGDLAGAEALLLKTLLKAEAFGQGDPRLAYTLDYLGTLNMQLGMPAKAAPVLERAVKAFKASRGLKSAETYESMGRLAETYDALEQYAKSEPLRRTLVEASRGDAMQQSADLNSLALSIDGQGRQKEALGIYQQALELREKNFGPQAAELPEILNNIARVHYMAGDYGKAEPLYSRAIAIDEAMLKPGDPQLSDDYLRLAALLKKTGRGSQVAEYEAKAEAVKKDLKPEPKPVKNSK